MSPDHDSIAVIIAAYIMLKKRLVCLAPFRLGSTIPEYVASLFFM